MVFYFLLLIFNEFGRARYISYFIEGFLQAPVVAQIALLSVLLIPAISLFVPAIIPKFKTARGIFQYFFTVELPISTLLFLFLTGLGGSYTPHRMTASIVLIVLILILTTILSIIPEKLTTRLMTIVFFIQTFLAGLAGYFALLYIFFLIPLLITIVDVVTSALTRTRIDSVGGFVGTLLLLGAYLAISLWLSLGFPYLLLRWLWKRTKYFYLLTSQQTGSQRAKLLLSISLVTVVIVWGIASLQIEKKYLAMLQEYTKADTFETKKAIAAQLQTYKFEAIKEVAYLTQSQQTYPFDAGFSFTEGIDRKDTVPPMLRPVIDSLFLLIAKPYVYRYSFSDSYGSLSSTIKEVLNYDIYSDSELSIDTDEQRNRYAQVSLINRSVAATTQQDGRLSLVTVTETFSNRGSGDLETISDFVLPAGSVVVDLKLGPNLEFPGLIAPRGAARKTYEAELRQRRDPALLQQVGPDQYKLRVFPVPGNGTQKVQYTYVTALTPNGFGLPRYVYQNGYKTESSYFSEVMLNNQTAGLGSDFRFFAPQNDFCELQDASTGTQNQSFMIATLASSTRFCTEPRTLTPFDQLSGKQIAILLDVSIINKETDYAQKLKNFLRQNPDILAKNTVVLHQLNKFTAQAIPLTASNYESVLNQVIWFGQGTFDAQLAAAPTTVDAVIYITSNEFMAPATDNLAAKFESLPPVYIVSPDLENGPAWHTSYHDVFFGKHISQHDSIEEAWLSMVAQDEVKDDEVIITPYWQVTSLNESGTLLSDLVAPATKIENIGTDFPELYRNYYALRQSMDATAKGINLSKPNQDQLTTLDTLTNRAEQLNVVTPLTSLVALVNQTQLNRLEENNQLDDRYSADSTRDTWTGPTQADFDDLVTIQRSGITNPTIGTVQPGTGWSSNSSLGALNALGGTSNFSGALDSTAAIGAAKVGSEGMEPETAGSPVVGIILTILALSALGFVAYRFAIRKKVSQQ